MQPVDAFEYNGSKKGKINMQCRFDDTTKEYLSRYYCILDEMIWGMTSAELCSSISHNFIVQMIPHHRAAIEMSENILKYTENAALCSIASNIIKEQTNSIENMLSIKDSCSRMCNSKQDLCRYQGRMEQIMQIMFSEMKCARATNQINCNFMWEMIPHHEGAVKMSMNTLRYHICPELVPILQAIITSQKKGIDQMRQLERSIGCSI